MNSEDEENGILNRLENIEKRIGGIEDSLARLVQDAERRTDRREAGLLVLGVICGGLLSVSVNFYTEYYMLAVNPEIDIPQLVIITVILAAFFAYLLWWVKKQLR